MIKKYKKHIILIYIYIYKYVYIKNIYKCKCKSLVWAGSRAHFSTVVAACTLEPGMGSFLDVRLTVGE